MSISIKKYKLQEYLNKLVTVEARFKDHMPGMDWFKCFLNKYRDLIVKLADSKRFTGALTYEFFKNVLNRY